MTLPEIKVEEKIADEGLDKGIENLTQDRIDKAINQVLSGETGARFKAYVETCVHCALCADACHIYLSRDRDPKFSPAGKVKRTIGEIVKNKGKVGPEFIRQASEVASTECNCCKR